MTPITPIVLAAGASTRMGRPKALLDFDGRACLELVLDALQGHLSPIVVLGPNFGEIQKQVDLRGVRKIINHDVELGPSHSLKVALMLPSPRAEAFLFMPVDYPLLRASDVARIVDAYEAKEDPRKAIFIPSHAMRRGHPVLFRKDLAREFLDLPAPATPRDVINRDPGRLAYVDFPEAYVLMDMDTPEDYVRCLEAYRARNAKKP
jgi:molybdenum cofactor cytidylyltransferase